MTSFKSCRTQRKGYEPAKTMLVSVPGYPSQAGSKPGDVCPLAGTKQLVASGAAGVQIPLPAPIDQTTKFISKLYFWKMLSANVELKMSTQLTPISVLFST